MKTLIATLMLAPALAVAAPKGSAWALLPSSARDASLAGGMASLAQGVEGYSLDPSALSQSKYAEAYLSHTQWHEDVKIEHAAVALDAGKVGGLALGLDWADFGTVTRYQASSAGGWENAGELRPQAGALSLAWGSALGGGFSLGALGKAWRQSLDGENDTAASASASLRYRGASWSAVAGLRDWGGRLGGSELPTQFRAGLSVDPAAWLGLGVELTRFSQDGSSDVQAAAILRHGSGLALRGGIARQGEEQALMSTVGASVALGSVGLDLAGVFQQGFTPAIQAGLTWAVR